MKIMCRILGHERGLRHTMFIDTPKPYSYTTHRREVYVEVCHRCGDKKLTPTGYELEVEGIL